LYAIEIKGYAQVQVYKSNQRNKKTDNKWQKQKIVLDNAIELYFYISRIHKEKLFEFVWNFKLQILPRNSFQNTVYRIP